MNPISTITMALLTFLVIAFAVQKFVVLARIKRELEELNERRAERVERALGSTSAPTWDPPLENRYPFSGWVELLPGGAIRISGQQFNLTDSFEITARDDNHIPRAKVISKGSGVALIRSHGQTFDVTWRDQVWNIETMDSESNATS